MGNTREYQRCTNCVMDTSDSMIQFDDKGVCDFCNDYYQNILPLWKSQQQDENLIHNVSEQIRKARKDKEYDCIIGMSGGLDSSYLCYVAKEIMKLNPLVYVVDTGWNLDVANDNIRKIIEGLDLDVHVEVVDKDEMMDLQLSFLKSGVPYQDLPQDHAIFAGLYNYAVRNGFKYVLTGANNATECIRPPVEWVYMNDIVFIKDVHKRFGRKKMKSFPLCGLIKSRAIYPVFFGLRRVAPLNMIDYSITKATDFLQKRFGWQPYENKHYENIFTRFYEGYYLPHKFGFDKRKVYFSNLVLTGIMSRDEALRKLEKEPYSPGRMEEDKRQIAARLGISEVEMNELIENENRSYKDFKNSWSLIRIGTFILRKLGIENKKFR